MKSKAVLEFDYPEDEDALLFASKGAAMYEALSEIKLAITGEFTNKADLTKVLTRVRAITDEMLSDMGSL
jgi:hypothetical protein|tara:strand:- start:1430 stop:1639 length:210 start_codon:yes stop_codon:yes gene_type:complete